MMNPYNARPVHVTVNTANMLSHRRFCNCAVIAMMANEHYLSNMIMGMANSFLTRHALVRFIKYNQFVSAFEASHRLFRISIFENILANIFQYQRGCIPKKVFKKFSKTLVSKAILFKDRTYLSRET